MDSSSSFITKSYADMRQQFHHTTPLYPLLHFMRDYAELLNTRQHMRTSLVADELAVSEQNIHQICKRVQQSMGQPTIEDRLQVGLYYNSKLPRFMLIDCRLSNMNPGKCIWRRN